MLIKRIATGVVAALACLAAAETSVAREWGNLNDHSPAAQRHAKVYGKTLPPIGWVRFCQQHTRECNVREGTPSRVRLSDNAWMQLVRVNTHVNRKVAPVTDQELYNVAEHWTYPADMGDCEDYVLLKRRYLMSMGWPREALLVTVVLDHKGLGHAVLTVVTDQGDFVLDNQNPEILPWKATRYKFIKRQDQAHPNRWVALVPGKAKKLRTVSGRLGD